MSNEFKAPPTPSAPPNLLSPEESIWKRYSAHQEFPLSLAASVVLHLLAAGLVVLGGVLVFQFGGRDTGTTMEAVTFSGGGGSGEGVGNPQNPLMLQDPVRFDERNLPEDQPQLPTPIDPKEIDRDAPDRIQEQKQKQQALEDELSHGEKRPGLAGSRGQGGPGSGGGQGKGRGPGEGDGEGPGKKTGTRHHRQARWTIILPREDPEAFLRKLVTIQAMLLVPDREKAGIYRMCEDLSKRPVAFKSIDQQGINDYNRLWYMSHDRTDTQYIATALYLKDQPRWMAIFIPQDLETEMLRQEFNYKKKSEAELRALNWVTQFTVDRRGDVWDVQVKYQGPRK